MNKNPFRWGIIGLGRIAHKFAEVVAVVEDGVLYAVAGRNIERAEAFAKKIQCPQKRPTPPVNCRFYVSSPSQLFYPLSHPSSLVLYQLLCIPTILKIIYL